MYGIFGKLLKMAFRTCMRHGGVGPLKKSLPPGPARGPLGLQKWVPRADYMESPCFEGAESISGLGFT